MTSRKQVRNDAGHIYRMSFTSGALLFSESLVVARAYQETQDWEATRARVVAENLLRSRTANTSVRLGNEVISRLRTLTTQQFVLLLDTAPQEQRLLLWLAVCKRYAFIRDFAIEVVLEKCRRLDLNLQPDDYRVFLNKKAEWHPEVERVADATKQSQRQFVFRMLREVGILSKTGEILPLVLPPRLSEAIVEDDALYLNVFPTLEPN